MNKILTVIVAVSVFIKVIFYPEVRFVWNKSLTYIDLYNEYSRASYSVSIENKEGINDLEGCKPSYFKENDPISVGYVDGCKAAIYGRDKKY